MNILYFSPILWSELKQRPQHIAEELSKQHMVYYIEPSVSLIKSKLEGTDLYKYYEFNINDNLRVIRPSGKFRLPKSIEIIDILGINCTFERLQIKKLIYECDIIWLGSPVYYSIFKNIKNKKIIYDKMDDYVYLTENKILKRVIHKNEYGLINKADIVFTTGQVFYDTIIKSNRNVHIVKNAVENFFANTIETDNSVADEIDKLRKNNNIVFGYIGTIGNWFDYEVIDRIISYNRNFHVVLVGLNKVMKMDSDNVHYYDSVEKGKIPAIINSFDYCLYNFIINNFLNTIDPVKLYEYLSMNKKVISVRSIETDRFNGLVNLYGNYEELMNILNNLGSISEPFKTQEDLNDFIEQNSWHSRVQFINNRLKELYNRG